MSVAGSTALEPSTPSAAGSSAVLAASSPDAGSAYTSRDGTAGERVGSAPHAAGVDPATAASVAPALRPVPSSANAPRPSANDIAVQNLHADHPSARPVTSKQQLSPSDVHRPSQPHAAVMTSPNAPGPAFEPLILATDDTDGTMPPREHEKRQVSGVSMGIGVIVGALAIALVVLAFLLYLRVRRRREEKWRRRRLTHVDPGSRVGEHVDGEKIPVSPFLAGSPHWPRNRVLHISSDNFLEFDEEAGPAEARTPRSGDVLTPRTGDPLLQSASSPTPSSSTLLVPAQSSPGPSSAQTSGSHGSRPSRARTPPAALALADTPTSSANAARHSHGDGAVEFTLHPPSTGSASTSNAPSQQRRNSIEKRPERTLVAHNALTPPPPTTPMRTPAPRYSRGLWGRLSGLRQSIVPPAYESPRPERTTHAAAHLAVPEASHVQWAPMRIEEPGPSEPAPHPFAARRI